MYRRVRRFLAAFGICFPLAVAAEPVAADEMDNLSLGAGGYDVLKRDHVSAEFAAEYRFGERALESWFGDSFRGVGPLLGIRANTDGAVFGHADFFFDIRPTDRLAIWPGAGLGGYGKGDSLDLGGVRQFHLGFAVAYEVAAGRRLGLSWSHISNANTHENNPGVDSLLLTYSIALKPLF